MKSADIRSLFDTGAGRVTTPGVEAARRNRTPGWWRKRLLLAALGHSDPQRREEALSQLSYYETATLPLQQCVAQGSPRVACGAAIALARRGDTSGILTALSRSYNEEWALLYWEEGSAHTVPCLTWFERAWIGEACSTALRRATLARQVSSCLESLCIALSALRALRPFPGESPLEWWQEALFFGNEALTRISGDSSVVLVHNMARHIRQAGIAGLFREHSGAVCDALARALRHEDTSIGLSAIAGVQGHDCREALPLLTAVALQPGHPLASAARNAIRSIAGAQADPLSLLRPSLPEIHESEMLRPAHSTTPSSEASDALLRPDSRNR